MAKLREGGETGKGEKATTSEKAVRALRDSNAPRVSVDSVHLLRVTQEAL